MDIIISPLKKALEFQGDLPGSEGAKKNATIPFVEVSVQGLNLSDVAETDKGAFQESGIDELILSRLRESDPSFDPELEIYF